MKKSSKTTSPSQPQPESFEAASAELESIVATMEAGQMTLEASLSAYERGMTLLQYCQNKLQDAQQQVRILEGDVLKDFTKSEIDDR